MSDDFCQIPAEVIFILRLSKCKLNPSQPHLTNLITGKMSGDYLGNISVVISVDRNTIFKVRGNKYFENILNVNCIHPVDLP